jgi:hypothetical protein
MCLNLKNCLKTYNILIPYGPFFLYFGKMPHGKFGNLCRKIFQFGKKVIVKGVTIVKINLHKSYFNCSVFSVISKIQRQAKMCINVKLISIKIPIFFSQNINTFHNAISSH